MKWADIIAKPQWADLDAEQQAYARQKWVDTFAVPEARKAGFTEDEIISLREKAIMEFDNGQGMVSSFFASAGRGLASTASGVVGGLGAITNDPGLMATADEMDRSVANALPVNPSLTKTNFVGNALGQAGGVLATAGAGGALAKGLAGVRAIAAGSEAAALTSGVLSGARGGAQDAEQYGMTGGDYAARVALGGLTEFVTERLPFGMATETGLAQRLLGGAAKPSRALTFGGGVVTESLEEGASQIAGNAANMALAPAGTETPTLFTGVTGAMAGGAIGGSFFGAVNAAAGVGAEAPLPPPAGFTNPTPAAAPTVANPATVAPAAAPIPIGKVSVNGLPLVYDGTGWQRPATEEELAAEPGMLLRPLDPNDAADGAVIAAATAKAQAALRRQAAEKDTTAPAVEPVIAEPVVNPPLAPAEIETPAAPAEPLAPPIEEGVPPLPGLPPPPGMRWDMEGNAVPLVTLDTTADPQKPEVITSAPLYPSQLEDLALIEKVDANIDVPPAMRLGSRILTPEKVQSLSNDRLADYIQGGVESLVIFQNFPAANEMDLAREALNRHELAMAMNEAKQRGMDVMDLASKEAERRGSTLAAIDPFASSGAKIEGQAQPLKSPVLTPSGHRPIGTLQPGDTILASDGTAQTVRGTYPQGVKGVYQIILGDGRTAQASADHLWLARLRHGQPEVVTTLHLLQGLEAGEDWTLPVMEQD